MKLAGWYKFIDRRHLLVTGVWDINIRCRCTFSAPTCYTILLGSRSSLRNTGMSSSSVFVVANFFVSERVNLSLDLVISFRSGSSMSLLDVQLIAGFLKSCCCFLLSQLGLVEGLGRLVLVTDSGLMALQERKD